MRNKRVVRVVDWHRRALGARGFEVVDVVKVDTPRLRHGANRDARVDGEAVIVCEKEPF